VVALGVGFGALNEEVGMVVGVGAGVALADGLDGTGMLGGAVAGALLGVAVVLLGAGLGSSWVQATGPTRNAATKAPVMRGRRTVLLVEGCGSAAWSLRAARCTGGRPRGVSSTPSPGGGRLAVPPPDGGNVGRRDVGAG
jgi:hypothetical protein